MGKDKASDQSGDYMQRELEEPVQKVVDDKLNDPAIATKQGERDATEVLREGAAKSLRETFGAEERMTQTGATTEQPKSRLSERADEHFNDPVDERISLQSSYEWVANTARSNPVLVVGGAIAVGALLVIIVSSQRSTPPARVRAFERRVRRDIASAEKALRKSYDKSGGVLSGLAELSSAVASRFGTWDTAQLEALKDRAGQFAGLFTDRASSFLRSRN
jgi:hypothetical protein